jgi:thiol:disulfide interchange protein
MLFPFPQVVKIKVHYLHQKNTMLYVIIGAVVLFVIVLITSLAKKKTGSEIKPLIALNQQDKSLTELIADITSAGRIPVLYFSADWCPPSVDFKKYLSDPLMQDALTNVTLIEIDTDNDNENYAARYNARSIPLFVKVDLQGKSLGAIDGGAWDANIPVNMAPPMKAFIAGK